MATARIEDKTSKAARKPVDSDWRRVVDMWLAWNEAYDRANEELYRQPRNAEAIERTLDQLDQLRRDAERASRELLSRSAANAE